MERITPLAKILAEANGIEWETLSGTGPGGQISEQDVLDYLTRVMSGEAEPPSTPVDAPPPDWDGQDKLPDLSGFDTAALSNAGVESDLTDYMQQNRAAAPATTTPSTPSADEFELDDEEETTPPAPTPAPAAPATPAPSAGLGNLLSRLYHKEEAAPTPVAAPPVAPTPAAPPVTPVVPAPVTPAPEPAHTEPVVPTPVVTPAPEPVHTEPVAPTPVVTPTPVSAPVAPVMNVSKGEGEVAFGTYLRRDVNVALLSDMQAQLKEALERDVPLALLVARAALRHAKDLDLQKVAIKNQDAAFLVAEGSLRDALSSQNAIEDAQLWITDAGSLGLDDLHYAGTPSLSIGRIVDGRASLSLQGDLSTEKAAQFLNAVALTLEKPVILLV